MRMSWLKSALSIFCHIKKQKKKDDSSVTYSIRFTEVIKKPNDDKMSLEIYNWLTEKINDADTLVQRSFHSLGVKPEERIDEQKMLKRVGASPDRDKCPKCGMDFGKTMARASQCKKCHTTFRVQGGFLIAPEIDKEIQKYYKLYDDTNAAIGVLECARHEIVDKEYLQSLYNIVDAYWQLEANRSAIVLLADKDGFIQNKILDYTERYENIAEERRRIRADFEVKRIEAFMRKREAMKEGERKRVKFPVSIIILAISKTLDADLPVDDKNILVMLGFLKQLKKDKGGNLDDEIKTAKNNMRGKITLNPNTDKILAMI